jgi:hypothetical protein
MINLKGYKGFCFLYQDSSNEFKKVYPYLTVNDIPIARVKHKILSPEGYIPIGSVEWVQSHFAESIKSNHYPEWLKGYLFRNIWESNEWILGRKLFVKPSDKEKRFTGFVTTGTYKKKKKPPFFYSDVVTFINEWRYYISAGKVLEGCWYWGDEINTPEAPELSIKIPKDFFGTLDFGTLSTGEFALVEAHNPYSCGYYGKDAEKFLQWTIDGWEYLSSKYKII